MNNMLYMVRMLLLKMLFKSQKTTPLSFWHGWRQINFILKLEIFYMLRSHLNLYGSNVNGYGIPNKKGTTVGRLRFTLLGNGKLY